MISRGGTYFTLSIDGFKGWIPFYTICWLVPAAEIRDHETGLVSEPYFWFQSRQLFLETHETEANSTFYLFL